MLLLVAESQEGFNKGDFAAQGLTAFRGIKRQRDAFYLIGLTNTANKARPTNNQ